MISARQHQSHFSIAIAIRNNVQQLVSLAHPENSETGGLHASVKLTDTLLSATARQTEP